MILTSVRDSYGPPRKLDVDSLYALVRHLPDVRRRGLLSLGWRMAKAGLAQDVVEAVVRDALEVAPANAHAYYALGGDRLGRIVGLCAERRAEVEKAEREDAPVLFTEDALRRFKL